MTWYVNEPAFGYTIDGDRICGTAFDDDDVRFTLIHRKSGVVELDAWEFDDGPHVVGLITRADLQALLDAYPKDAP